MIFNHHVHENSWIHLYILKLPIYLNIQNNIVTTNSKTVIVIISQLLNSYNLMNLVT